ncbi:MAG TPA: histidine phosphatase family protein [Burkholderiaceae bacterium]
MELILWRHAEAEDGAPDQARALTRKGQKQAAKMAAWLLTQLPGDCRILVSPAVRTQQTAGALGLPYETVRAVGTSADARELLAAAGWPHAKQDVLIVGHQPTLGQVVALVMTGEEQDLDMQKGNVCWISSKQDGDMLASGIRVLMAPEQLA